jgi:ammonia channel protein AmtB
MTFMVYQLMFAIITPALITGATAERMKFSGTVLFLTLWFLIVYRARWRIWCGARGGLLNAALGGKFPTLDFAGERSCTFLRASQRWCARFIWENERVSKAAHAAARPGAQFYARACLWVGWFGFNAGSALASNSLATSAFVATHPRSSRGGSELMLAVPLPEERTRERARCNLRSGGRTRGHYACGGICRADARAGNRIRRRRLLPLDGDESEGHLRV